MDTPASIRLTAKLGAGLQQAKVTNSAGSRYNKATVGRMIDHIFYVGLNSRPNWCTANRFMDLSDHMPITAQWNIDSLEVPKKSARLSVKKILLAGSKFTSNNRFTALADANIALDELFNGLTDAAWAQSARIGAVEATGEVFKTVLSKNTLKKIKMRRKKFKKLTEKIGPIKKYMDAKSTANVSIRADRKAAHAKKLKLIADQLLNNGSKEYWRYIKSCTGNTFHSVSNGPVYDLDKNLITGNEKKLEILNQHFSDLAKDATGNSRDPSKWQALLSDDSDYYPECDQSISWADITTALNDTPNNKAPGADGVPNGEHPEIHDDKCGGACAQEGRHEGPQQL
ncbi:hypothetical protein AYI70_g7278 [Smittium culicis]|uniref:Endonuclease/exonuclease/phosphatase domain-containing protein n=1 Tax=Smittium culicis TaxID=133412 RepID=A0A1R1XLC5_9FUNG|nr:hypothetical protein AYI70_g7278 [Smittium culicis]